MSRKDEDNSRKDKIQSIGNKRIKGIPEPEKGKEYRQWGSTRRL